MPKCAVASLFKAEVISEQCPCAVQRCTVTSLSGVHKHKHKLMNSRAAPGRAGRSSPTGCCSSSCYILHPPQNSKAAAARGDFLFQGRKHKIINLEVTTVFPRICKEVSSVLTRPQPSGAKSSYQSADRLDCFCSPVSLAKSQTSGAVENESPRPVSYLYLEPNQFCCVLAPWRFAN